MISTSDSLNRVKIISVILKTKLSQAFSFHSHSELVSPPSKFSNSVSFRVLPSLTGSLTPRAARQSQCLPDMQAQPRAPSWAPNALIQLLLDISTFLQAMCKINSSRSCLGLQVHTWPDGWVGAMASSQKALFSVILPDFYTALDHAASLPQTCPFFLYFLSGMVPPPNQTTWSETLRSYSPPPPPLSYRSVNPVNSNCSIILIHSLHFISSCTIFL